MYRTFLQKNNSNEVKLIFKGGKHMKSFSEKLEEYKKKKKEIEKNICKTEKSLNEVQKSLNKLQEISKENKVDFCSYLADNIIFKDYEVGKLDLEGEDLECKRIYYPILHAPEGFKVISSKVYTSWEYDDVSEVHYSTINNYYVLQSEEQNLEIHITASSHEKPLIYSNKDIKDIKLLVKNNYIANIVYYHIEIDGMQFSIGRYYGDEITIPILKELLKGKIVYYKELANMESFPSQNAFNINCMGSYKNYLLYRKPVWKENLRRGLKEYTDKSVCECIIKQIEKISNEIKVNERCEEVYYLNEKQSLIVRIEMIDYREEKMAYEDEQLVLEIPSPIKWIQRLYYFIINKAYYKVLLNDAKNEDVVKQSDFIMRLDNIDLNQKICVLDVLEEIKS